MADKPYDPYSLDFMNESPLPTAAPQPNTQATSDPYNLDFINQPVAAPMPSQSPSEYELAEDDYLRSETSWSFWGAVRGTGRTIARMPVRATQDIYNAVGDLFSVEKRAKWDEDWFGKPQNAVEDITADIGSYIATFLVPGGAIAKGATVASKAAGGAKVVTALSKTEKGRKAVKFGKIVGEGAVAGVVADYITSDTGDERGMAAVQKRLEDVAKGAAIGAGINLTGHGLARTVGVGVKKIRALKKVQKAAEGKGDAVAALKSLKKAIDEENALKSDVIDEVQRTDEALKPLDLNNLSKETDDVAAKQTDDLEVAPEKAPSEKPVDAPKKKETQEPSPEQALLEIDDFIKKGQSLPDQVNRLIRLNVAVAESLHPKMLSVLGKIAGFSKRTPSNAEIDTIRQLVGDMELDLHRYKKMIELRARAGNLSGKLLVAFKGKPMDFSKPFTYKPEALKHRRQVDELLSFVQGTKNGSISDESVLAGIQKELGELAEIEGGKSLADVISDSFASTRDKSTEDIWSSYQKEVTDRVTKELVDGTPKQKAALGEFTDRMTKTLTDAVKVDKPVAKVMNKALREVENILGNPDKYKDTINKVIKEISDSDKIKAADKEKAIDTLNDVLSGQTGKTLFESLPQRQKLVNKIIKEELENVGTTVAKAVKEGRETEVLDEVLERIANKSELNDFQKEVLIRNVRVELANAITDIKDDIIRKFISKELYQKVGLKEQLKELDEMSDKSIEEIRQYLADTSRQIKQTPEDIAILKNEVVQARKELETRSNNAFVKELLNKLGRLQEYQAGDSRWELFVRAAEKYRLNSMLFSPRTWVVGIPSAFFNLGYQPVKRALQTYAKARDAGIGEAVSRKEAFDLATAELKAMSEYFSNWTDMLALMKQTWKNNGRSGFNPKSFRRHEEDLVDPIKGSSDEPLKLNFKDRKQLKDLIARYGSDTIDNRKKLDKFLGEVIEGDPTTTIGKLLDPLFSISFRFMGTLDEPFKYMGMMRALRSSSMQEGMEKGLTDKALNDYVAKRMKEAVGEKDGLPTWLKNEEFNDIEDLGLSITYQEKYADKAISNIAMKFSAYSRSGDDAYYNPLKIALRLAVPFIKTPAAIFQWTVDNLPVYAQGKYAVLLAGKSQLHRKLRTVKESIEDQINVMDNAVTSQQRKDAQDTLNQLHKDQEALNDKIIEAKSEAYATAVTSTVIQAGITTAIALGNVTGTGAYLTDDQRRRLLAQGWRPNSIRVGDKWYSYARFEPWSTYLSMQADFTTYMGLLNAYGLEGLEKDQNPLQVLHASFVENLSNKYFVRGLYELLGAFVDEDSDIESVMTNYAASLSPRIIRDLATINEPFQTQATDSMSRLKERWLGINPGQYQRNLLGEKVERVWSQEGLYGLVSPMLISDIKDDPILEEIAAVRGTLGQSRVYNRDGIDSRKYRSEAGTTLYDSWMEHMSTYRHNRRTLRQSLTKLIKSKEYKNAPERSYDGETEDKRQLIASELTKYRREAWKDMKKKAGKFKFYNDEGVLWTDETKAANVQSGDVPSFLELIKAKAD